MGHDGMYLQFIQIQKITDEIVSHYTLIDEVKIYDGCYFDHTNPKYKTILGGKKLTRKTLIN